MRHLDDLFAALERSEFRSRFKLRGPELRYLQTRGIAIILQHARDFVQKRLAPAHPHNDGRQTPMRNHPVFIAQHATATCCRGCLEKWHRIPHGQPLTEQQIDYILRVIALWLEREL